MAINFLILDIKPQGIQTLFKIQFFFPNVANYLEEWQFVDTPPHTHTHSMCFLVFRREHPLHG